MVLAALSNRAHGYPGESLVFGRPKTRICTNRCQREPAGCLDWQERGLAPPEAVTAATAAYLEAQDSLAAWLDECCERDANAWERSQTLFASWKAWADRSGHLVGDTKTFRDRLDGRDGIEHQLEPGTKRAGYRGVRLKPPEQSPMDPYYCDR
jgi:phage/plasmid-associated DNA primase